METDELPPKEVKKLTRGVMKELSGMGIEFCVIGGVAINLLAFPRATKDIDICANVDTGYFTEEELNELEKKLGDEWKLDRTSPPDALVFMRRNNEENELEIYVNKIMDARGSPKLDNDFWSRVRIIEGIPVCSREDVIALKSYITDVRPQDIDDIEMLLRTGKIDSKYLEERLRRWGCFDRFFERAPTDYHALIEDE
ncbi:MAG: nucleotidyltransferase [Candidatus Lokiarchaeota archaeon]|nr:nucleotidyltransferase [Candidatus Lokiarchaeota archaeon]